MIDFCRKMGIVVTAYSPLGSPAIQHQRKKRQTTTTPQLLQNPVVQKLAAKHNKTSAQIVLRFNYQRGVAVIPKSARPKRLKENISIFDFELTDDDMNELMNLDQHGDQVGKCRKFDFLTTKG